MTPIGIDASCYHDAHERSPDYARRKYKVGSVNWREAAQSEGTMARFIADEHCCSVSSTIRVFQGREVGKFEVLSAISMEFDRAFSVGSSGGVGMPRNAHAYHKICIRYA